MSSQACGLRDGAKQSPGHTGCQVLSILFLYPRTALPMRRFSCPPYAGEKQAREVNSLAWGGPGGTEGAANVLCTLLPLCHLWWISISLKVDPKKIRWIQKISIHSIFICCMDQVFRGQRKISKNGAWVGVMNLRNFPKV